MDLFSIKTVLILIISLIKSTTSTSQVTDESAFYLAEELGFGIKGVTHYLKHLLEGCENVGNLNTWIMFMESYWSCEEAAWPYKSEDEKLLKTDVQLIEEFCKAWPERYKCGVQLATKLDLCYGQRSENGTKGTNAIQFSESLSRLICQHQMEYLSNLESIPGSFADRRSLKCYSDNKNRIRECIQQESVQLEFSNDFCRSLEIVQKCFKMNFSSIWCNEQKPFDFVKMIFKQIKYDFKC